MLQTLLAILALFLVPGLLLVYALYPRKGELDREYDLLYRVGLGVVLSVSVVVLLGFGLNSLGTDPATGRGYVTAEVLWPGIALLSLAFFFLGWFRGAHPWMARIHPALARPLPRDPRSLIDPLEIDRVSAEKFRTLAAKRDELRSEVRRVNRRLDSAVGQLREHYRTRRTALQEQLKDVDLQLRQLEDAHAKELY